MLGNSVGKCCRCFVVLILLLGVGMLSLTAPLGGNGGLKDPRELIPLSSPVPLINQGTDSIPRQMGRGWGEDMVWFQPVLRGSVTSVASSPDGSYIASGSWDNTVRIWRVSDGLYLKTLAGHTDWVTSVAFSPDGQYIVSGSKDKTIKIWRVSDGSCLRTLAGHTGTVNSVAFSPDGNYIASGSEDATVRIWRVSDGSCLKTIEGHTDHVWSVAFSPDGNYIASGSDDTTVRIWRVSDGSCLKTLAHTDWVYSVAFSPDGSYIASGGGDRTIKIWRVSDGSCLKTLAGHTDWVTSVAFSPDGQYIASGGGDETVKIWRVSDGSCLKTLAGHTEGVTSIAFSPDGSYIASGSGDETVKIWRAPDGLYLKTLEGHRYPLTSVAFSPDRSCIASGSNDRTVRIWRVSDGLYLKTLAGHTEGVTSVAFSPDGSCIASGSGDTTVRIWRVSDGACLKTLAGHTGTVNSVAFSPDGSYIASGSNDETIKIWRVSDGACLKTLAGHTEVSSVAFSPDGSYIASGNRDNTVRIWQVSDGSCLKTLAGHTDWVWSVAFSPDGNYIASGSRDTTIRIWRAPDGFCLKTLAGHMEVNSVAFYSDGSYIASGSGDGLALWRVILPNILLSLSKSADKSTAALGGEITYTLNYENKGNQTIDDITIADPIPQGTSYVSGSATGGGTYDSKDKKLTWKIQSLSPGAKGSVSFKVKVEGGEGITEVENKASLTSPAISVESNNVSTPLILISLSKSADKSTAALGGEITYTLNYENKGDQTVNDITIADPIPQGTSYVSGSATGGGTYDSKDKKLIWKIQSLSPGAKGNVSFKVKVKGEEGITNIENKATLTTPDISIESNSVSTTISVPKENVVEDVNYSFNAGLFAGIYGEVGASISVFGAKGAEAAVGAANGVGMEFTISPNNNTYSLSIGEKSSSGTKLSGSLGKIAGGPVEVNALTGGITASISQGNNFFYPSPLTDSNQAGKALIIIFTEAGTYNFQILPGVGRFVDALLDFFQSTQPYKESSFLGADLVLQAGLGEISIGKGEANSGEAQISNDVAGSYLGIGAETIEKVNPSDWASQASFTLATGGTIQVPFIYGKSGATSSTMGFRLDSSYRPLKYFYSTTVDEGTNISLYEEHTIHSYEVECDASLFGQVAEEMVDNRLAGLFSGDLGTISPIAIINDITSFDDALISSAQEGQITYQRGEEKAQQVSLGLSLDIGGSLGVGGGVRIGFDGEVLLSHSYPLLEGTYKNGARIVTKEFNRATSSYHGVGGVSNYFRQMIDNVLHISGFVNSLKNFFHSVSETIEDTGETVVDWFEGAADWLWSGVGGIFSQGRQETFQAELVGYELKAPTRAFDRGSYSITFVPYRSGKVLLSSRQPAQEFTGMRYAVNLNVKKSDGTYLTSFPADANTLKIKVGDDQLQEREFDPSSDWQSLNIFWFNPQDDTWYQIPTKRTRGNGYTLLEAHPENPGTYAGGIASLPPDREPPQITIISPQNATKTSLTPILSASVSDPRLKESSIKFLLDGKEIDSLYTYSDQSLSQFLALPPQPLPQGSHSLTVSAEDDYGNKAQQTAIFTVSPPQPQETIDLLSLPFAPRASPSQLMSFDELAIWQGTGYIFSNDPQFSLTDFQGFWAKLPQKFDASLIKPLGYVLGTDKETMIPLKKGWQAIGLPWSYSLPLSDAILLEKNGNRLPFSQAGALIGQILFRWDGSKYKMVAPQSLNIAGAEDVLSPWFGYWIRVKDDCNLLLPKEPWNVKATKRSSKDGFALEIKSLFPDGDSEEVYIGMGNEEIASPCPPPPPYASFQRRLSLLKNGQPLYLDIRKEGEKGEWQIAVKGGATLLFPNLSYLPKGYQIILSDGDKRYYLKTTSAVKVDSDKVLKLEVGRGLITPLLINMLDTKATRGGVNITWSVNIDCQVKLSIRGVDGRLVKDLGIRSSSAGGSSLFWDGKGGDGRSLPAGIYIVELIARDETGQMARAIKAVMLR